MSTDEKYQKQLEKENNFLRKQLAIYHNGFIEIVFSTCKDISATDRLSEISFKIQSIRTDVSKVLPTTTVILV